MYAVIQTGGKQYRVQPGDIVQIEKLEGDVGTEVKFGEVLMTAKPAGESSAIQLGKPLLSGASVQGEIVGQGRGDKVVIIKMKRRKQYRRTQGHRQFQTQILVTGISAGADYSATLSAADKKATLDKFQSYLTPKGEAFSKPIRGVHTMGLVSAEAKAPGAAKKAAPKKAAATGETSAKKPAAAKKAPAKKS